jgi:hypothetical protein
LDRSVKQWTYEAEERKNPHRQKMRSTSWSTQQEKKAYENLFKSIEVILDKL